MAKRKKHGEVRGYGALTAVGAAILLVYSISLLVPTLWAAITSLKSEEDFYYNGFRLAPKPGNGKITLRRLRK